MTDLIDELREVEEAERKARYEGLTLAYLRYSEWRLQTLSADVTVEVPSLAHHISEDVLTPVTLHFWVEATALTERHLRQVADLLDNLVAETLALGRGTYRRFPPTPTSFATHLHLVRWHPNGGVDEETVQWSAEDLLPKAGRTWAWDVERFVQQVMTRWRGEEGWDPTRWDLETVLTHLQQWIVELNGKGQAEEQVVHGVVMAGWSTEGVLNPELAGIHSQLGQILLTNGTLLLTAPPTNTLKQYLTQLGLAPKLAVGGRQEQLVGTWTTVVQSLVEPQLEVTVSPNKTWGQHYTFATNLPLFLQVRRNKTGVVVNNVRAVRYPVRLNFLFRIPSSSLERKVGLFVPVVWDELVVQLRTAAGKVLAKQVLPPCTAHPLPVRDSYYQVERELNQRLRQADTLRRKLEELLEGTGDQVANLQSQLTDLTNVDIGELLTTLDQSYQDLSLAFQIIDYLSEEELLMAEVPPTTKSFQAPDTTEGMVL